MPTALSHLALNALFLDPGRSGGPETYMRGVVPAIAKERPELEITIVTTRRGAAGLREDGWGDFATLVALETDEGERLRRARAELLGFERAAAGRGADLLHSLATTGPVRTRVPAVVTTHDLTFFREQTFSRLSTPAMKWFARGAVRNARRVITISAAAKREIVETLGTDPEKIDVIHHGAGRPPARAATDADARALRERWGLPPQARLVVCVAALRAHKNQVQLVRALPLLGDDVVLVLSGVHETYAAEVEAAIAELGLADRVRLPGYLPDADVEALYAAADCMAFPSRAEGFGLPLVEAMRRDVPIACSDLDVMREIGGDVAHYFPIGDLPATAAAITAAMADRGGRGPGRAAQFTWEASARGHLAAYDRALAG